MHVSHNAQYSYTIFMICKEYVKICRRLHNMGIFSSSGIYISLQVAADEVEHWITSNKMALNYDKTKELGICLKKSTPVLLTIDGRPIQQVNNTCLLGVTLSEDLKKSQKHRNIYISSSFSKELALTLTISSTYTL